MLRSCYETEMRLCADEAIPPVKVRWFFVPENAPTLPYLTPFNSLNWHSPKDGDIGPLGEVVGAERTWRDGSDINSRIGSPPRGTASQFLHGDCNIEDICMKVCMNCYDTDNFYPITAVLYHAGNAPPNPPDVSLFDCTLYAHFWTRVESGEGDTQSGHFTHILICPLSVDIRDDYDAGTPGANYDTLYYPDETGTSFVVRFVELFKQSDGTLAKRAYLDRIAPGWPTSNL